MVIDISEKNYIKFNIKLINFIIFLSYFLRLFLYFFSSKFINAKQSLKNPIFISLIVLIYSFFVFNNSLSFYRQEFEIIASMIAGMLFIKFILMNKLLIFLIFIFLRQIMVLSANNDTYINTTNITYDEDKNIVELADNSKINVNDTNILVDKGIIDYDNDIVEVYGDFYLYQELNILSGKDLVGNTRLTSFKANEVSYIYNNDLKIDSNKVERSDDIVNFYDNFLTPCELEGFFNCPTWSLRIDKTKYDLVKDKFNHYDTILQIADYKVFYLPYFSHYGSKAPRKRGFLTPTLEFSLGGDTDTGIVTPYYLPINQAQIFYLNQNYFRY